MPIFGRRRFVVPACVLLVLFWGLAFAAVKVYVASLLYSGLVGTGLAWVLWLGLVRAGEASRVAAYVFFVPLVSVVIGAIFLDERLNLSLLVGAALVVGGIYLANRTPARETAEP